MLRKAQIHAVIWGAAVFVREAVLPRLPASSVPEGLLKFMVALDGWLPGGPPRSQGGQLAPQRLSLILARLRA